MRSILIGRWAPVLLALAVLGCAAERSAPAAGQVTRWVLVHNIYYRAQGNEPEYVWVPEDQITTSATTVLFGKRAAIAPPDVVPRYAPPPGNGVISPLQGGPYAAGEAQRTAVAAPVSPPPARMAAPRAIQQPPSEARRQPPAAPPPTAAAPGPVAAAPSPPPGLPPRGYVVYVVDAKRVVIDLSAQHGLKNGDIVRVTREKVPIVHPVTGAYLGELEEEVATAQIVELREKFAIAEIREVRPGVEVQVKDRVVPRL